MAYHKTLQSYSWDKIPLTLTVAQAAELLHCCRDTVRKMCQSGKLKAGRVNERSWVIARDEIETFVKGGKNDEVVNS